MKFPILPEKVDVIVTETFGALALAEGATADLRGCAARNLVEGGRVIPHGIDLYLAPVADLAVFHETAGVFGTHHGANLGPLRDLALRRARSMDIAADSLAAPAKRWASLSWPADDEVDARLSFTLAAGWFVGFAGWFTLRLSDGVSLPTGPEDPDTHWGQTYLPVPAVAVTEGATLDVSARLAPAQADRRGLEVHGTWRLGDREGQLAHRVR